MEILNDLLCFDKIECGILDLHKLETPVIPFISDCVKMFSSQAREAGINISFITSHANAFQLSRNVSHSALPSASSTSSSSPVMSGINVHEQHVPDQEQPYGSILDSDKVLVDKFKMNQVMRNLISNALKFTPSGGSVIVSAFFLPDERTDVGTVAQRLTSSRTNIPSTQGQPKSILSKCSLASQYYRQPRRNRRRNSSVSVHPGTLEKDDDGDDDDVDAAIISSLQEGSTHACSNVESNTFYRVATGQRESILVSGRGEKIICSRSLNKVARRSHNNIRIETQDDRENIILGKLKIVVEDTGCGISDVDRSRLFNEIVQFTPEILQGGGGSGLGLYISSHIIQMHSGTIQAISEGVGKGSTFVVELDMRRMRPAFRSI